MTDMSAATSERRLRLWDSCRAEEASQVSPHVQTRSEEVTNGNAD